MTETAIPPAPTAIPTAAQALAAHGFDGDKLIAYASTIARREMTRTGSTLGDRHEDLVMYLVEVGCRTATRYNPSKSSTSYTFDSYIYDVMARRVTDFYRRKSEGFGDRRKGHDNRITLVDKIDIDHETDALANLVTDDQVDRYTQAAQRSGKGLSEWMLDTLDVACEAA